MPWNYSDKTKQLFMDAVQGRPGTHLGEIENADGMGEHGSIACGDAMRFTFRVRKHPTDPARDIITDARYLTFGCTSAIAASEALCLIIEEKEFTPIEALRITNQDIVEKLEGLPMQKIHCSVMGAEALEAAVFNWAQKRGVDLAKHGVELRQEGEDGSRLVCKCFNVSENYLRDKIKELNLKTVGDVANAVKAGGACGSCQHAPGGIHDILGEIWDGVAVPSTASEAGPHHEDSASGTSAERTLTPFQFSKKVEKVIDDQIRPQLKRDGGDVELVDIKDTLIYCRLQGACAGCPGASVTLKLMIEQVLRDEVDPAIRVIAV